MIKRHVLAGLMCVLQATGATAAETNPNTSLVLATVNGNKITLGHIISYADSLPDQFKGLSDEVLFQGVLDQLIQQTAIGSELDRNSRSIKFQLENEARTLLAAKVLMRIEKWAATEDLIQSAYEAEYVSGQPKKEYRASHILVATEKEALTLIEQLKSGADFALLAKEKSTGPSGPGGGDLGWFLLKRMVPEFGSALAEMQPAEISEPIQTQFGWHVIQLAKTRDAETQPLHEVQAEIRDRLITTATNDAIARLESAASISRKEIEVDWSLVRRTDLLK